MKRLAIARDHPSQGSQGLEVPSFRAIPLPKSSSPEQKIAASSPPKSTATTAIVDLRAPARASSTSCDPWGCSCQRASDRYGVWHYKNFGSAPAAAVKWWHKNKCRTHPARRTPGWKIFGLLTRWKFKRRYVAELERRVAKLAASEPGSARHKLNARMLAAATADLACFIDPAWPSTKTCGGSPDVSQWMQHFVKFYLGVAGSRPGEDIPVIGPPRTTVGEDAPEVAKGDTVSLVFSLRGWIGGAKMLEMPPEAVDARFAELEEGDSRRTPFGEEEDPSFIHHHATVKLGGGTLIAGLEAAAATMRKGEAKVVLVPPREAYGDEGYGPIPGGAHLVVDVKVTGER